MTLPTLNKTLWTTTLTVLLVLAGLSLRADPAEATVTAPAGALTVATNQNVSFTATSTDSVGRDGYTVNSFSWSFGDGTFGSGSGTTHGYTVAGIYTATLTVSYTVRTCKRMDLEGNCTSYIVTNLTATASRTITVLDPPSISSFSASAVSVGVGKPVTLTWATANATSLTLSGQGPVSGTSITVYPTLPTTYMLTASNSVGSASASVSVTTYTVGVSLSPGSVNLLLGESRVFTATVTPANQGVTWSATGGTLSGSTATGTTYTATASGQKSLVATSVEDTDKRATATVEVATVSVATPVPAPASAQTYLGGTVTFSALVSGAVDTAVTWTVNGGGEMTPTGVFRANARGDWTVTATSKADTTRSASAQVHVLPLVVTLNPPHATVRSGQTQAFTATLEGPGTPSQSVTWQVVGANGGSINSDGIYTAPDIPGDYTIRAVSNQDTASFATATVHVPGWALKWRKDIVYLGSREISELDPQGVHVTLVDHLGSPRFQLGASGTVESAQKFLPFGESLSDPAFAATFAKGFTNHEQTDLSGLIYMQARFYAPWYGRFLSPDPARDQHFEETQSWNIYSYVQNNPVMMIDPTGMYSWREFGQDLLAGAKEFAVQNPFTQAYLQTKDTLMNAPANAVFGQNWRMESNLGQAAQDGASASTMAVHALQGPAEVMAAEVGGRALGKVVGKVEGAIASKVAAKTKGAVAEAGEQVVTRTTRSGDPAIRVTKPDGSVTDISSKRVKEFVPNTHPKAPPGTLDKVKFKESLPGSKGYKRTPTPEELARLKKSQG